MMKAFITAPSQNQAEEEIVNLLNMSPNKDTCCLAKTIDDSEIFFGDGWFGEDGKTFELDVKDAEPLIGSAQLISNPSVITEVNLLQVKPEIGSLKEVQLYIQK
jgi:hypothetical protein